MLVTGVFLSSIWNDVIFSDVVLRGKKSAPATWSQEPDSEILEVRHVEAVLHVHAGGVQHGIKKLVSFLLELRGHVLVGCGKDFRGRRRCARLR